MPPDSGGSPRTWQRQLKSMLSMRAAYTGDESNCCMPTTQPCWLVSIKNFTKAARSSVHHQCSETWTERHDSTTIPTATTIIIMVTSHPDSYILLICRHRRRPWPNHPQPCRYHHSHPSSHLPRTLDLTKVCSSLPLPRMHP